MSDPLVFGCDSTERVVAVEPDVSEENRRWMKVFIRNPSSLHVERKSFLPFIYLSDERLLKNSDVEPVETRKLSGAGKYCFRAHFSSWDALQDFKSHLSSKLKRGFSALDSPVFLVNDPVRQFLIATGITFFKGMSFPELRRMQVDIETDTEQGFEFCNADREGDAILVIGVGDQTGRFEAIRASDGGEKKMLERFVEIVKEYDPDVIEGHNIFGFDLPYIAKRAAMHKVKLRLGRDGSVLKRRSSRFSAGDRTISFQRFSVYGRHIADTYFMAQLYDLSSRAIESFSLKELARFFGVAPDNRTHIAGSKIAETYKSDPEKVIRYLKDDISETRELSALFSPVYFAQAQILPLSYQDVCVKGNGSKIDDLILREYFRQDYAVSSPVPPRQFSGGYTDIFMEGLVQNVHHCDIRSMYPSLILTKNIFPCSDELGVFGELLEFLLDYRLDAKKKMQAASNEHDRNRLNSMQSAFKILINSFYGYLGFAQGHFNDFDAAERVASEGRALLGSMVEWLKKNAAQPVEIDTDGIYFVPPDIKNKKDMEEFRTQFKEFLPKGIDVEFDGEYKAMFSYKMKNYALLDEDGKMSVKGAALKSRGMEPYLRDALREMLMLILKGEQDQIPALRDKYADMIAERKIDVAALAKTETLREPPSVYEGKISKGSRGRNAAYELALRSGRDYRANDQVSYYIAGKGKRVAAHAAAKLLAEFDPENRDENTEYYIAKLDALFKKFTPDQ